MQTDIVNQPISMCFPADLQVTSRVPSPICCPLFDLLIMSPTITLLYNGMV